MNILGINAYHGDVSAVLVRDGELVAAVEEERFRRIKHVAGFPHQAIRACLEMAGITPQTSITSASRAIRARIWRGRRCSRCATGRKAASSGIAPRTTVASAPFPRPLAASLGLGRRREAARRALGRASPGAPREQRSSSRRSTRRRCARSTGSATSSARRARIGRGSIVEHARTARSFRTRSACSISPSRSTSGS